MHEEKRTFFIVGSLLILAALAYLPFVYHETFGEADGFRMAIGVIDSIRNDNAFNNPLQFRIQESYAYYALLYLFTPIFRANFALVTVFMNYINVMSAILMVIPFFIIVRRYWGTTTAILANMLLIFVPSWWNTSLYGHPVMQAILFTFIGLALVGYCCKLASLKTASWKLTMLDGLIVLIFSLSLAFRMDAVLIFPLITATLLLERLSFKTVILRSILYGVPPVIIFFVLQINLLGIETGASSGRITDLLAYYNLNRVISNLKMGLFGVTLASQPLYFLAFGISCLYLAYKQNYLTLFLIWSVFIVNFLFWVADDPGLARHFIYVAPVVALAVAIGLSEAPWGITLLANYKLTPILATILFIMASFMGSELLYPLVRAYYPWKSDAQNYSVRVPIRSIFINKYYSEKYFQDAARFAQDLDQLEPKDKPIFVMTADLFVILKMQLLSNDTTAKVQKIRHADDWWQLYFVTNRNNEFIFLNAGDLQELLRVSDAYKGDYLAIDPYHSWSRTLDITPFMSTFQLLPMPPLPSGNK